MTFLFLYAIMPYVLYLISKRYNKPNLVFVYLFLLALIGFDSVSDYQNYVTSFQDISKGFAADRFVLYEPGFVWLNELFSFWDYGYIFVIGIATIAAYYTMYRYFEKYDVVALAMILFCAFGTNIIFDNIIRQNIAFGIINFIFFLYLEKKVRLWTIIVACLVAAQFHTSALFVMPIYLLMPLLRKTILSFNTVLILTLITYGLSVAGVFESMQDILFSNLGAFELGARFMNHGEFDVAERGFSIVMLCTVFIATLPCLMINKTQDANLKIFINITWIINIVAIIFFNLQFFSRITEYFIDFKYISIAYFIKKYKITYCKNQLIYLFKQFIMIPLFCLSILSMRYFGFDSVYRTIFSENCKEFKFYRRVSTLENHNEKIYSGRNDFITHKP